MSTYTICKGCNYSTIIPSFHSGIKSLKFKIKFDSSCNYELSDITCIKDINKAYGFSYGNHHTNSIRLGWRVGKNAYEINKLELFGYVYNNKAVKSKKVGGSKIFFEFDTWYDVELTHDQVSNLAVIKVNTYSVSIPYTAIPDIGYYLKPYFGGNCKSPQTMKIEIV